MELILGIIAFLLLVLNVGIFSIVDAINEIKGKEKEADEEIDDFFRNTINLLFLIKCLKQ